LFRGATCARSEDALTHKRPGCIHSANEKVYTLAPCYSCVSIDKKSSGKDTRRATSSSREPFERALAKVGLRSNELTSQGKRKSQRSLKGANGLRCGTVRLTSELSSSRLYSCASSFSAVLRQRERVCGCERVKECGERVCVQCAVRRTQFFVRTCIAQGVF
jgi:hypothetical protein